MINVGIIGCGDVATHSYMPGLNSLADRAKVVAGVRYRPESRVILHWSSIRKRPAIPTTTSFWHTMRKKMDLVFNLTPAPLHRQITAKALEAGYSVYSEKPIASSLGEANELVEMADAKGLHFFCAPAMMVTARMMWLKEYIHSGAIGNPYFIKSHHGGMGAGQLADI